MPPAAKNTPVKMVPPSRIAMIIEVMRSVFSTESLSIAKLKRR